MSDRSLVPVLAFFFPLAVLGLCFAYSLAMRYLTHRERMAMIDRGMEPPYVPKDPTELLRRGTVTALMGLALLIGLGTMGLGPWLLGGLLPLFAGLAMLISYYLSLSTVDDDEEPIKQVEA